MPIVRQMTLARYSGMQYAAIARRYGFSIEKTYALIKDYERQAFAGFRQLTVLGVAA